MEYNLEGMFCQICNLQFHKKSVFDIHGLGAHEVNSKEVSNDKNKAKEIKRECEEHVESVNVEKKSLKCDICDHT